MDACRAAVEALRQRIVDGELEGEAIDAACEALESEILRSLSASAQPAYPRVINAAGVLIHTNLVQLRHSTLPTILLLPVLG